MTEKQITSARGWMDFYHGLYPIAGKLRKWDENQSQWPLLTAEELEELNAECIIM